jgi:acyl carrier protein
VKIRGFRIEPGEVEAALTAHPRIGAAVVTAHEVGDDLRLTAFLVPADPADGLPAPADLQDHLRSRLPEHMIPTAQVELAALPLTANGKVDKTALPAADRRETVASPAAPPRTPAEELIAEIWREVLEIERLGVHDDFFALGGHSLLATRVVSRIRRATGVELTLDTVFDQPTVAELAALLDASAPELEEFEF